MLEYTINITSDIIISKSIIIRNYFALQIATNKECFAKLSNQIYYTYMYTHRYLKTTVYTSHNSHNYNTGTQGGMTVPPLQCPLSMSYVGTI